MSFIFLENQQNPDFAIQVKDLSKSYPASKRRPAVSALKNISLQIPRGSFFGLLGPNGAGKSTLINILGQMVNKTSGQVEIWGIDQEKNPRAAASAIGIVPQELNMDPFFTPEKLLDLQAGLYGVPKKQRRTKEILAALNLSDKATSYARSLSGGMRRRLMVAKAMVHMPPILVLDEPTAGVDIELRKQLWEYMVALNQQGVTILLTTHYLEEAQQLCDRIAIIHRGQITANDTKKALLGKLDSKELIVRLGQPLSSIPPLLANLTPRLSGPQELRLVYKPSQTSMGEILQKIQQAGLEIVDLSTIETSLEDIFISFTRDVA
ncbi:MAG TPA: ABC transporter ATP-binding protein [Alphaproteobacteria bacterium]|nr:ABC transporter ATP-binding protein [Alphaproteobacteria bacterium]